MNIQTPRIPSVRPPRQPFWQWLHGILIRWGLLVPPESSEAEADEEEQEIRRRVFFQFRRRPGGR